MSRREASAPDAFWVQCAFVCVAMLYGACDGCRDGAGDEVDGVASVRFVITDAATGARMPALITLFDATGTRLRFGNVIDRPGWGQGRSAVSFASEGSGLLAIDQGLVAFAGEGVMAVGAPHRFRGTFDKQTVTQTVPPGHYDVFVSRGAGYDVVHREVEVRPGDAVDVVVSLKRLALAEDYVAADLHVHTTDGSGDAGATARQQLQLAAARGLDVVASAEHGQATDLEGVARGLWPQGSPFALLLPGLESAALGAHFGVFPLPANTPSPDPGLQAEVAPGDARGVLSRLHAQPGQPLVQMVHGRLGWASYMDSPQCGPWAARDRSAAPPCAQDYDLIEVLYSWNLCSSRVRDVLEDWYALMRLGLVRTGVASSDAHFLSGLIVGTPRTWVRVGKQDGRVPRKAFRAALENRQTIMSSGPVVSLRSGEAAEGDVVAAKDGRLAVTIRVQAANHVPADRLELRADGRLVRAWPLVHQREMVVDGAALAAEALDFTARHAFDSLARDTFITAEVSAREPQLAQWSSMYQATPGFGLEKCPPLPGHAPGTVSFAVTSPLLVDADGDGRFAGGPFVGGGRFKRPADGGPAQSPVDAASENASGSARVD